VTAKRLLVVAGTLASVVLLAYFAVFAYRTFSAQNVREILRPATVGAIAAAAAVYALVTPLWARAWSRLLTAMGEHWPTRTTTAIMSVTQLAKYVPGNVALHAGRAAFALAKGMNPGVFGLSIIVETLLATTVSVLVGVACWLLAGARHATIDGAFWQTLLMIGLGTAAAAAVVLAFLKGLPWLRARYAWLARWVAADMCPPNRVALARAALDYGIGYLVIGLALWVVAHGLGVAAPGYLTLTAAFTLAWLVGFVAPGLPAGLGAREGVMTLLLASEMAAPDILNLAVAMRVATVGGDALNFALGAALMRKRPQRAGDGHSGSYAGET
jgi:hypothetical protein